MTQYAEVATPTSVNVLFVQSAEPEDLEDKVNAAIAALAPAATSVITALSLFGAGDGHTFGVIVESALLTAVGGGALPGIVGSDQLTVVRCYLAGSADELAAARAAAGVPAALSGVAWNVTDEQMAGGSKGTRMMGMTVYSFSATPAGLGLPYALVQLVTAPQVIAGGANIIAFEASAVLNNFSQPTAGEVQYNGPKSIIAAIDASVTVEQTGAGDVTVEIVYDPNGTPVPLTPKVLTHVGAGAFDNVSVPSLGPITPNSISTTASKLGVRVTAAGAGEVLSAALRIFPIG